MIPLLPPSEAATVVSSKRSSSSRQLLLVVSAGLSQLRATVLLYNQLFVQISVAACAIAHFSDDNEVP